jgi:multiple sugar transport system substrate-binding protein
MFAGGVAPDVMYTGGGYVQELAAGGQLMEIGEASKRFEPRLKWDEFLPEGMDAFRYGDGLYGIPRDVAPVAIFYNKELFDAAGIAYPKPGWTREEFLEVARKLTRPEVRQYGIHVRSWYAEYLPAIWANGGRVLDERKTRVVIDSPEAVAGLRFFQDLLLKYKVAPPAAEQEGTFPLFNAGRAGMSFGGYWSVAERRQLKFRWGVVPLPREKYGTAVLLGAGYSIAKSTKDPQGAWRLAEYMTNARVQREVALMGLAIPARLNALTADDLAKDPILATFVDVLKDCRPPPFVPRWREVEDRLNRHIQRLMLDIDTPEQTAAGIKQDVETIMGGKERGGR